MLEALATFISKNFFIILWVSAMSILGAVTNYIRKIKSGRVERFSISELIGDVVISFFLGVTTYFVCKGAGLDEYLIAGLVGLVSHMGTRGLVVLEDMIPRAICKYLGIDCKGINSESTNNTSK